MTNNAGDDYTFFHRGVEETYKDVAPFLKQQEYIADVRLHIGEMCEYNLTRWRQNFNFSQGWQTIYGGNYNIEWSKTPWFISEIDPRYSSVVFISTTPRRWWDKPFDMAKLISKLGNDVRFLGSDTSNYNHFVQQTGIHLPFVCAESFSELVSAIASCKMIVGTLSAHISIADALHKKRIALQTGLDHEIARRTNSSFLTAESNLDTSELIN